MKLNKLSLLTIAVTSLITFHASAKVCFMNSNTILLNAAEDLTPDSVAAKYFSVEKQSLELLLNDVNHERDKLLKKSGLMSKEEEQLASDRVQSLSTEYASRLDSLNVKVRSKVNELQENKADLIESAVDKAMKNSNCSTLLDSSVAIRIDENTDITKQVFNSIK